MEIDIQNKFEEQDMKLEAIYVSVEKTRKYFLVIMWVTLAAIVLPMIIMVFALPKIISTYTGMLEGLI